ncbi:S-DNA-T family DNA segregation ATPase FtsK/SpoIIIE [Bacillus thermophilus]|uniref:S-DNA-T family DNA segregation ATPase FtsK/SpoIIIE n=1 Tax=Siminovitchia thermophila TaxID=1245522 RepID=A0ABS2RAJ1_9BACI|nr:DNA translocase FtsK [Siminovitchia thermophila]MBM7716667.1 S-DNA-T family DNA segregation ATPase FtsK/SpoIIIE [Siminovitchia thermophila]
MAKRKKRSRKANKLKRILQFELAGIALFALCLISIVKLGAVGRGIHNFFYFFLGEWYMAGMLWVLYMAAFFVVKREWPPFFKGRLIGIYFILSSVLLFSHIRLFGFMSEKGLLDNASVIKNTYSLFMQIIQNETSTNDLGGGMIGAVLFSGSHLLFDTTGTKIISFFLIFTGVLLLTGKSIGGFIEAAGLKSLAFFKKQWAAFKNDLKEWRAEKAEKRARKEDEKANETVVQNEDIVKKDVEEEVEPIISSFTERDPAAHDQPMVTESEKPVKPKQENTADEDISQPLTFTEVENKDYKLPPNSLLVRPKAADQRSEYKLIHSNAAKLEKTFQSFGVKARVTQVHLGPAVTKYEVHPDAGVKVSRIVSLSDDLALALAAKDIRIEAPIPGKSAIGIEVPNSEVAVVSLREVLESKQHQKPEAKLQIGLGRDITGEAVVAELNKMPHLLVAGATGSGKSVCINGIITSILMRAKPHEVKMMMIDPKMVELNVYNGIPHLLAPVVTDARKASQALKKVVSEMERRYELFSHTGTRNIEGYNEFVNRMNVKMEDKQPLLPYIVVIVDELADLMMVASNDVEDSITRLAQMARAAGIHLIIATQRPSVDVITGVIKANIPSRIAFAVSSQTDSRTILDTGGAEKLLGRGDMLFLPVGASKPVRVQGAFLSDKEVENVVEFVISQQKAQYQEEMIPEDIPETAAEVEDELYEDAVQLIAEMQTASVSMLQRRFRIGYTRAARLIDEMEARGIVGPYEGSKPRAVLIPKQTEEQTS